MITMQMVMKKIATHVNYHYYEVRIEIELKRLEVELKTLIKSIKYQAI